MINNITWNLEWILTLLECHGHVTTGLAWSIQLVSVGSVNTNGTLITDLSVGDFGAVFLTWHNA